MESLPAGCQHLCMYSRKVGPRTSRPLSLCRDQAAILLTLLFPSACRTKVLVSPYASEPLVERLSARALKPSSQNAATPLPPESANACPYSISLLRLLKQSLGHYGWTAMVNNSLIVVALVIALQIPTETVYVVLLY
jgi:hypothetical protein